MLPVLFEGETKAVIELASLQPFTATHLTFLEQLTQSIGVVLNTIEATMRTENLLQQSQQLTIELQTRQTELQQTNEELALEGQAARRAERRSRAQEQGSRAGAPRARGEGRGAGAHLEVQVRVPREHVARAAHAAQLDPDPRASSSPRTRRATWRRSRSSSRSNIHSAGTDLLTLINDILDLSKIESGTVTVEAEEITFASLRDSVERTFHHLAESKNLAFHVDIDNSLPRTFTSDPKRLQQILKNLLSNAFKFTAQGHVTMRVLPVDERLVARPSGAALRADARSRSRSPTPASASRPRSSG